MSSENLHEPRERLSAHTIAMHQAIVSLMEELDAVDWYQQRADGCDDAQLREVLLHNMREEVEHACMVLEWLRRNSEEFDRQLRTYLFREGDITELEEIAEAGGTSEPAKPGGGAKPPRGFTVGPLK
ncbi:MAG: ferritin [Rhodospirillales bacterium]|nr:ferritin [Rhodospirillales bacterium]